MNDKQLRKVRKRVSQAYADAVAAPATGSCCEPAAKGIAVKLAGYTSEELDGLPVDARVNSFGCGNPLAFSQVTEGSVVVDLGCGAGIDLLLAARKVGPTGRAIGVDMTDEMIAKARAVIDASGLTNVEVRKGLIEELPIESASVDWVISNCVINLSPEKEKVFAQIARVLRPGGRMLVSDIVVQDLPTRVRGDFGLYCSCIAGAISEEAYCTGLRRAGLVDVEIRERIAYDSTQLSALIGSDLANSPKGATCCDSDARSPASTAKLADLCDGKVFGVTIFARIPA